MKNFKMLSVAAGAMLLIGGSAKAADLYTPMPEPAPVYTGGWYFSAFGGANWLDKTSFDIGVPVRNSYDTGYVVGGAVGYDFGQAMGPMGMRIEGEVSYRNNSVKSHVVDGVRVSGSDAFGETSALAGMANILFDLNTGMPFSIYGGGGIGAANVEFDGHGVTGNGVVMDDDQTVFAWQAIAGMGYEITPNMVLDLQYRYFNASSVSLTDESGLFSSSTDYKSHAVLGGIRFKF
jgi:opacity protein-like surface antigen